MGREQNDGDVAWFSPDTNFFLQNLPPEQVRWATVTNASDIRLVVVRTVQREIDDFKAVGNARRATRARTASALFKKSIRESDGVFVLREKNPKVSLRLGQPLPVGRPKPDELDLDLNDDRIIEQTMATSVVMNERLVLLTGDSGLMQTARHIGLEFVEVPEEWALAPEPDATSKELTELKRRMDRLESRGPRISVRTCQNGTEVDVLRGVVDSAADVSEEFIDRMTHLVTERRPLANPFENRVVTIMVHSEWDKYTAAYQAWLADVKARIKSLTESFNSTVVPLSFSLHLDNEGAEPADHVQVLIEAEGPIRLMWTPLRDAWLKRQGRMFAEPPTRPDFPYANLQVGPNYGLINADMRDAAGDCTAQVGNFTWVYTDPAIASERCTARAAELRHGLDGVSFDVHVVPAPGQRDEVEGALLIRISARNLPETFTKRLPVRIGRQPNVVHERVLQRLEQEFNVIPG